MEKKPLITDIIIDAIMEEKTKYGENSNAYKALDYIHVVAIKQYKNEIDSIKNAFEDGQSAPRAMGFDKNDYFDNLYKL
jgi:hypothetical protein